MVRHVLKEVLWDQSLRWAILLVFLDIEAHEFRFRRQVYKFSLNVSKGTEDADVTYGLPRSDIATVQVQVSPLFISEAGFLHKQARCA